MVKLPFFRFAFVAGIFGSLLLPAYAQQAQTSAANFQYSSDKAVAAQQHAAYDVVHRYEELLNKGDTASILALYAPDSVAEWNDKPTFTTEAEKKEAYDSLFKAAKFSTVFGYASINVYGGGNVAVVRTFHHKGASVNEGGKEIVDLNREVFILNKIGNEYKIALYIFNTDPVQGEG